MQEELITPIEGITVPPDEIIKLNCLQMAIDCRACDAIGYAKEMYSWIKEDSPRRQPDGAKWDIRSDEVKYSYDLTGCAGTNKTAVSEESKEK